MTAKIHNLAAYRATRSATADRTVNALLDLGVFDADVTSAEAAEDDAAWTKVEASLRLPRLAFSR